MRPPVRKCAPAVLSAVLASMACGGSFTASGGDGGKGGADASVPSKGGALGSGGGAGHGVGGAATGGGTASGGTVSSGGTGAGGANAGSSGKGGRPGSGGELADSGSGGRTEADSGGTGGSQPSGGTDGGPPAIPTDGLVLWLRADVGVTLTSGVVSAWADQSPSHTDATQELQRSQPVLLAEGISGHPAILFDGADDFLQIGKGFVQDTRNITIFTIAQATSTDTCSAIFEASNGPEIDDISLGTDNGNLNYEIFDSNNEDVGFPAGVPEIFGVTHADTDPDSGDADPVTFFRNGSFASMTTMPAPVKLKRDAAFIGKTLYGGCSTFVGRIGELIVYDRAFSSEELVGVESYLQKKFGCCTK